MLSYQHLYHAGNLADVHKHAALTWVLGYMLRKDKPLSYLETHGGRGLYDLGSAESLKTGEAAAGIEALATEFQGTGYGAVIEACRAAHGATAYPGSPWIAAHVLRESDQMHVAELHPREHAALLVNVPKARVHKRDGFAMAHSICPPEPRRGLLLIDPSYEVKADYDAIPGHIAKVARAWPVGVILLWYPILSDGRHVSMVDALKAAHPEALDHQVRFPPAREGHRMVGSGLWMLNAPWGSEEALAEMAAVFPQS